MFKITHIQHFNVNTLSWQPAQPRVEYITIFLSLSRGTSILSARVWLGRTWGYAPHHPTQNKLEVAELERLDVGFPATRILHM